MMEIRTQRAFNILSILRNTDAEDIIHLQDQRNNSYINQKQPPQQMISLQSCFLYHSSLSMSLFFDIDRSTSKFSLIINVQISQFFHCRFKYKILLTNELKLFHLKLIKFLGCSRFCLK